MQCKVSGSGWLCLLSPATNQWVPVVELTSRQCTEYNEVREMIERRVASKADKTDSYPTKPIC